MKLILYPLVVIGGAGFIAGALLALDDHIDDWTTWFTVMIVCAIIAAVASIVLWRRSP